MLGSSSNSSVVMRQFGISQLMITNIKQKCKERISRANNNALSINANTIRAIAFSEINDVVLQFLSLARMAKISVTQVVLANCALFTQERLSNSSDILEQRREKLEEFFASMRWIVKFSNCQALCLVSLHREGGSVSALFVAEEMVRSLNKLQEFNVGCISSVEEAGLFFELVPRRTHVYGTENAHMVRRIMAMKSKDRFTGYV